ncbi:MAG: hypothetical protein NC428_04690 [Clostridium sp.]|nr:hypothetical protein [Clostridium sp.]
MDENYLDDLLGELSGNNGQQNSFDKSMSEDSGIDIDFSDVEDISLDELDALDDIDLSSLELDDIDFDDIDVTKLSSEKPDAGNNANDVDFDMESLIAETAEVQEAPDSSTGEDIFMESEAEAQALQFENVPEPEPEPMGEQSLSFEDEVFSEAESEQRMDEELFGMSMDETENAMGADMDVPGDVENMNLDDLFSALGIDDENASDEDDYTTNQDQLDSMFDNATELDLEHGDIDDIEEIGEKGAKGKKENGGKKSLSVILFGEPDEDDEEEERRLQAKKAEKEEKKSEKDVIKAEKKTKSAEKKALKKKQGQDKKKEKEQKKKEKLAELNAELEAEKDEKKLSTPAVAIVFAIFIALGVLIVLGSNTFNYSQVIKKATDYFERQRYRLAYDEVSGVDVKEDDQELKDRIYTVMYVERLYESYENNLSLNRPDKALDALLRGLEKHDVHYAEAVELGIAEDIDGCKAKIVTALWNTYGISEEEAYGIIALKGQEYSTRLTEISSGIVNE